jgi:hypothetical protein
MNQMNAKFTTSKFTTSKFTTSKSKTYWQEQREYFKEKTIAFKELKKERIRNNDERIK